MGLKALMFFASGFRHKLFIHRNQHGVNCRLQVFDVQSSKCAMHGFVLYGYCFTCLCHACYMCAECPLMSAEGLM